MTGDHKAVVDTIFRKGRTVELMIFYHKDVDFSQWPIGNHKAVVNTFFRKGETVELMISYHKDVDISQQEIIREFHKGDSGLWSL